MNDREKLIELLTREIRAGAYFNRPRIAGFADHLIANGVIIQKQGEWVYDHWCEFKCSACGEFSNSKPYKGKEKYCPNCGAKMKEVK